MEKKVFFNDFNAKTVLSCVALATSMIFASCEKEPFSVDNISGIKNAMVYISPTVFDAETSLPIDGLTYKWTGNGTKTGNDYSITPAADKTIAAGTATLVTSGVDKYLNTKNTVSYPSLPAGAVVFIPVTVLAAPTSSVLGSITIELEKEFRYRGLDEAVRSTVAENTSEVAKVMDIPFLGKTGQIIENIEQIEKEIKNGINGLQVTRSYNDEEIKKILIAVVRSYNVGISDKIYRIKDVTVPAKATVEATNMVTHTVSDATIPVTIDGKIYLIKEVDLNVVTSNYVRLEATTVDSHGHSHSHDLHGSDLNAGGGIAGK